MNITERKLVQINVDVQNDFCPGGALAVPDGDKVTKPLNKLAYVVREEGGIVVATQDFHPEQTSHFDQWPVHCVAGTDGADFHPDLSVVLGDRVIIKGTEPGEDAYSGFDGHDEDDPSLTLTKIIEQPGEVRDVSLFIGGLATDYCVRATVLDALKLQKTVKNKLAVYALTDAMRAVNIEPTDGEKSLAEMEAAGAILTTTDEVIRRIRRGEL
ncbi:hypothetical protein A3F64_00125 [Candidatus Saccharibacteria bacterium RIFCSPHIGHO2_12_FULL_42_8]|nr:MAG: hypothetical protein A3F64_00125 [Candidatus Saccharibacteria bacterium RIFCSPHIGHO2_12_FULL_42_8]